MPFTDQQNLSTTEAHLLRAVVDTAVDGVILIDAIGGVLMFNPACEKLFGYSAAEVLGQNVKMLMPPPYRDGHDGYLENYVHTGVKKIIGIGREVTGRRKNGTTFPMDLSVGEAQSDGKAIFVGIIHDLTERKRADREIRETAARMKALVETAVDGVILIDGAGRVQMFNPACEKLFGYTANEVIGQNVKMLMPTSYRDEHDRYLDNFHTHGCETHHRHRPRGHRPAQGWQRVSDEPVSRRGQAGRRVRFRWHHPRSHRAQAHRGTAHPGAKNGSGRATFRRHRA